MPSHKTSQTLPYTIEQLFALIGDVASYPKFLPWCIGARILSGNPNPMDGGEVLAELMIRFKMFQESYVSRVRFVPPHDGKAQIESLLERGPFTHLINNWHFTAVPGGTEVSFAVDFGFRSKLLEKVIGPLFSAATQKLGDAFLDRAHELYGGQ